MKYHFMSSVAGLGIAVGIVSCSSTPMKEISFEARQDYIRRASDELDLLDRKAGNKFAPGASVNALEARRELRQLKVTPDTMWNAQKNRLEATLSEVRAQSAQTEVTNEKVAE